MFASDEVTDVTGSKFDIDGFVLADSVAVPAKN